MAILEINLEKPALIEEYQYPEETSNYAGHTGAKSSTRRSKSSTRRSKSSGGNKGKLVGLLALLAGVGVMVWKLRSRMSGTEQTDFDEFDEESQEYEHGPEPDIGADESGGSKGKVAGLLGFAVVLVTLVAAARKARK